MSGDNGSEPSLDVLLAPVMARYKKAEAEIRRRETYLQQAKDEAVQLRQILRAAGLIEKRPWGGGKAKTEGKAKSKSMSEERLARFEEMFREYVAKNDPVLEDVPGSFTGPAFMADYKGERSAVNFAIAELRDRGVIRAAGQTRRADGKGAPYNVYVFEDTP